MVISDRRRPKLIGLEISDKKIFTKIKKNATWEYENHWKGRPHEVTWTDVGHLVKKTDSNLSARKEIK